MLTLGMYKILKKLQLKAKVESLYFFEYPDAILECN